MGLLDETRNLLIEYYDDEEDDYYGYEPSEEERKREATAKAKRLFPYEYKTTEGEEIDTTGWELKDYIEVAEQLETKYRNKAINELGMTLRDMQYASYSNTAESKMKVVVSWRRWHRFIIAYSQYL